MKAEPKDFIILILLVVSLTSAAMILTNKQPETIYIEVPVEVVKEVEVLEFVTIEVPAPFPVYVNNTKIIYVPTSMPLADWVSEAELKTFIKMDKTDQILYSTDFDCDDFALRVIHNAADIGRRVYYFYEWRDNSNRYNNHIMCMAYVKEEALYIIWEPQTDRIWSSWSSSVGG